MRRGALLIFLAALCLATSADTQDRKDDRPTLIIYGHGIHSNGSTLRGYVDSMFQTKSRKFDSVEVHLDGKGSQADEASAARQIGAAVSKSERLTLNVDMSLFGIDDLAAKTIAGTTLAGLRFSLRESTPSPQVLDSLRTNWNSKTEWAATIIEGAARAFKDKHPDGVVVVIGHSAATNFVDLVPTKRYTNNGEKQLIDLRVLSSTMTRNLKYQDPDHTVFITHEADLPSANMGNLFSAKNSGDLTSQGTIIYLRGYPSANYLSQLDLKPPLVTRNLDFPGHTYTQEYGQVFDMRVETNGGRSQPFRGKPQDVIRTQLAEIAKGTPVSNALIETLKKETPLEHHVGGITLTKPAEVAIDPAEIESLEYSSSSQQLVFQMKSGESIGLSDLPGEIQVEMLNCVLGDRPPEVSLGTPFRDHGVWKIAGATACLQNTSLMEELVGADTALGLLAFGLDADYRPPTGIPDYHPYAELALDDVAFYSGRIAGRVWIVPAMIRVGSAGNRLSATECTMAVRFEFYDPKRAKEYLTQNADIGFNDPAGDFLAQQLTSHYEGLSLQFPKLAHLKQIATLAGVLVWAHDNNVLKRLVKSSDMDATVQQDTEAVRQRIETGNSILRIKEIQGKSYFVVAAGERRKPAETDVVRPALIFNEFGLSRALWPDGTQSQLVYSNGRITSLIGRHGDETKFCYDSDARPQAIIGGNGVGVAVLWASEGPIVFQKVKIDVDSAIVSLTGNSQLQLESDVGGVFSDYVKDWLDRETRNINPPSPLIPSWTVAVVLVILAILAFGFFQRFRIQPVNVPPVNVMLPVDPFLELPAVLNRLIPVVTNPLNLAVVASMSDQQLQRIEDELVNHGFDRDSIVRATADYVERRDAVERGDVACILLNPGRWGPTYRIPVQAYSGKIEVISINSHNFTTEADRRIQEAIDSSGRA